MNLPARASRPEVDMAQALSPLLRDHGDIELREKHATPLGTFIYDMIVRAEGKTLVIECDAKDSRHARRDAMRDYATLHWRIADMVIRFRDTDVYDFPQACAEVTLALFVPLRPPGWYLRGWINLAEDDYDPSVEADVHLYDEPNDAEGPPQGTMLVTRRTRMHVPKALRAQWDAGDYSTARKRSHAAR